MPPQIAAGGRASARAFRLLLALYPRDFRDEYGRELALVFADRYRDAASMGERGQLWADAAAGVLIDAPKEHCHMIRQDLRYALRAFRQSPVFALTVTLTLALGIGANTAIFQLIDAVRLRSLPVAGPQELAEVRIVGGNAGFGLNTGRYSQLTRPIWDEIRTHQQAFSGVFGWSAQEMGVGDNANMRRVNGIEVSSELFTVLGVLPSRGRLLDSRDETSCPAAAAVVSDAFWQREMGGGDLRANTRIRVNGEMRDLVGVTSPRFFGLAVGEQFEVALPLCRRQNPGRNLFDLSVMGRLRPGWTFDRASAHLQGLSAGIMEVTAPTGYDAASIARFKAYKLAAYPAAAGVSHLRESYDRSLWLLLATTGLVLLIACANLANLLLARAATREREVAVRLALGASRLTLVRQLVTESGALALVGALIGVALAQGLSRVLLWALSSQDPGLVLSLEPSWRVLLFTVTVAVATCLVFGVTPAVRATRIEASAVMRSSSRGAMGDRGRFVVQRSLVVTQIAVSLVLLVGALLFVRSFHNLMTFDPGMRQDGIIVGLIGFPEAKLPRERINDYQRALVDDIRSLPGILSASTTTHVPLLGSTWTHGITVGAVADWSRFTWAGPGYFETMGIAIVKGRDFARADTARSTRVAIVNQTFVRRFVPDGEPIGKLLTTGAEPDYPATTYEIVGLIPDTQYSDLRSELQPIVFAPDAQHPSPGPWAALMMRTSVAPASAMASIKARVTATRPEAILELIVFRTRIQNGFVRERLLAMLSGFFGALAALLAMVGLYGMMSYVVAQRQQEIGVRVALGAERQHIVGMVMRDAGRLLLVGVLVGCGLALAASRGAGALLFGLQAHDPTTLAASCLLLAAIAAIASFVPARRASKLDPITALRQN